MGWFWKKLKPKGLKNEWPVEKASHSDHVHLGSGTPVNYKQEYPTNYTVIMNPYPKAWSASAYTMPHKDWWHATNKIEWLNDELYPKTSGAYAKKMAEEHKKQLESQLFFGKSKSAHPWLSAMTVERANALNNGTA